MFYITGTRTAIIKTYDDHEHRCDSCKDFDIAVAVYQSYFHFFFIPVLPNGVKSVKAHCSNCMEPFRNDSMNRVYESKSRSPLYFYTLTIIVALMIIIGFTANIIHNL